MSTPLRRLHFHWAKQIYYVVYMFILFVHTLLLLAHNSPVPISIWMPTAGGSLFYISIWLGNLLNGVSKCEYTIDANTRAERLVTKQLSWLEGENAKVHKITIFMTHKHKTHSPFGPLSTASDRTMSSVKGSCCQAHADADADSISFIFIRT